MVFALPRIQCDSAVECKSKYESKVLVCEVIIICNQYLICTVTCTIHCHIPRQWESFLNDYREFTAPQLQIKYDIYSRRVVASKEKYKYALKFLQDCQAEAYQFAHEASQLNSRDRQHKDYLKRERNVSRKVKAAHFELPHKLFLPNGTSAALVSLIPHSHNTIAV